MFLGEPGYRHLYQRNRGSESRNRHCQEENDGHRRAQQGRTLGHLAEDEGEGVEDESGPRSRFYARCEHRRHYGESGDNGEEEIEACGSGPGEYYIFVLAYVGCVGYDDSHSQGEGVEALSYGIHESAGADLAPVRLDQVIHSGTSPGKADRVDGKHYNQYEKHRNGQLAEAAYPLFDTAGHNKAGYAQIDGEGYDRFPGGGGEASEGFGEAEGEGAQQVAEAPSSYHGVVG